MLSHQRFHWDVYDANNDAAGDTLQDGLDCFWCVFTNLANYASGINAHQINEPWKETSLTNVDDYDGRGSASWRWNYIAHFNAFDWLWEDNCSPP